MFGDFSSFLKGIPQPQPDVGSQPGMVDPTRDIGGSPTPPANIAMPENAQQAATTPLGAGPLAPQAAPQPTAPANPAAGGLAGSPLTPPTPGMPA